MHKAGTVLKVDFGTFYHYGLADGMGGVIHNSKKRLKVCVDSYDDFSSGKPIEVSAISSNEPDKAVITAKRYLGLPYNLFTTNCEHFVRMCHGLVEESTQVQQYLFAALGAGIALKSESNEVKLVGGTLAIASLLTPREQSPFKNAAVATLIATGLIVLSKIK